jgi:hypothetical protein
MSAGSNSRPVRVRFLVDKDICRQMIKATSPLRVHFINFVQRNWKVFSILECFHTAPGNIATRRTQLFSQTTNWTLPQKERRTSKRRWPHNTWAPRNKRGQEGENQVKRSICITSQELCTLVDLDTLKENVTMTTGCMDVEFRARHTDRDQDFL